MIFRTMLPAGTQRWILQVIRNTQNFLPGDCIDAMVLTLVEEHGLTPGLAHQAIIDAHEIVIDEWFGQGS